MMSAEEFRLFSEPKTSGLQPIVRVIGIQAATLFTPTPHEN